MAPYSFFVRARADFENLGRSRSKMPTNHLANLHILKTLISQDQKEILENSKHTYVSIWLRFEWCSFHHSSTLKLWIDLRDVAIFCPGLNRLKKSQILVFCVIRVQVSIVRKLLCILFSLVLQLKWAIGKCTYIYFNNNCKWLSDTKSS